MREESGHAPNWRKWLGHLIGTPAQGLELGTWKGESAEWMLDNIFTHPNAFYRCLDTFEGSAEHHLGGIDCTTLYNETLARLNRFGKRVRIDVERSDSWLRDFDINVLDFIYVDAAHDAINVLRDSVLAWDALKIGGVLIWDDYEWTVMPDPLDCPRIAIDAFLAIYCRQIEVLGKGWQVAVRKLA